jgi:hypothetical protein
MANLINGKQSNDYFKQYYLKNKERIQKRNKAKYIENRGNPKKLLAHRKRSTEATRRYRLRHPEKIKAVRKSQYDNRKRRAFLMVSQNGKVECQRCGCDEISFLEINHINGGGSKEHRDSGRIATSDRLLSGKRKVDGLELVCRICNAWDYLGRKNSEQSRRFRILWEMSV